MEVEMTTLAPTKPGTFVPSEYQKAIFDALEENVSDLQVNAVAGSGKTTTLIQALNRIPYETLNSTLLCAFNKEIQRALEQRAPQGVEVKTLHAIGFRTLCSHMQKATGRKFNPSVDDRKYRKLIESYWIGQDYRGDRDPAGDDEMEMFKLIHFVRVTLTNPNDQAAILEMAAEREVELSKPERQVAAVAPILAAGQDMTGSAVKGFAFERDVNSIDFDDMVWLPFVLDASPRKFRLVMVDEAQDLNAAQLDLVLKCRADGGRMVFVGDPHQAIYAFCGADADAWKKIHLKTGARQLPLSVCYRCPQAVIDLAQTIIPQIEARPGAAHGVVETIKESSFLATVTNRDMVLCRITAPLISTCFQLISEGKPAKVRGRDIGAQLVKVVDAVEKMEGFAWQYFLKFSEDYRANQTRMLSQHKDSESRLMGLNDKVDSIQAVWMNVVNEGGRSVGDLRAKIETLFSDTENGHILLSTIHRAKGLEAARVFLLRPDRLPHPMAKSEASREQEENLRYVAYTRAMAELYIVKPGPEDR
jgi:DNA helicase-2/ATP-dependent DNA helicase PcrA